MLSRTRRLFQEEGAARGGIKDFVDSSYLNNKRPKVPGGAWPADMLRKKSMGDLQQIWFMLLRERNMLLTMRDHYTRHAEELGAWPAPSRLQLVEDSMTNIKRVLRERDNKANDAATAMFKDRVNRRVYRYPPGPQPTPGSNDPTSRVTLVLNRYIEEDRIRELFGRFDVLDDALANDGLAEKGIISIKIQPTADCLAAKLKAEEQFTKWWWAQEDAEQYSRWSETKSYFDTNVEVELAPGEFLGDSSNSKNSSSDNNDNNNNNSSEAQQQSDIFSCPPELEARNVPVPPPLSRERPSNDVLQRIKAEARTYSEKQRIQLGYFPNFTMEAPQASGDRPVHPDEIHGPWEAVIIYNSRDGADYAKSLNIQRIDGAEVLEMTAQLGSGADGAAEPYAANDISYDEALAIEDAASAKEKNWPHAPQWGEEYEKILKKDPAEVVQHNWVNTIDYMEREALLTGKNIWETPIPIDPTCGEQVHIPPFAKKPKDDFPQPDKLHTHV